MENNYELGNLCFGNSRGPYPFPSRELVNSKEWRELLRVLQISNYHCIMENYYDGKKRTNGLKATEYGGYQCKDKNGNVLFELFPYWWNGCTCGAEYENDLIYDRIRNLYLSNVEYNDYFKYSMMDQLNEKQKETFQILKNKMRKVDEEYYNKQVPHKEDCLELKHNFVYKPNTKDEFWIDWYKYPFRDAHMSKEVTEEEIKKIFKECKCFVIEDIK